jgi:hypothetical protein
MGDRLTLIVFVPWIGPRDMVFVAFVIFVPYDAIFIATYAEFLVNFDGLDLIVPFDAIIVKPVQRIIRFYIFGAHNIFFGVFICLGQ